MKRRVVLAGLMGSLFVGGCTGGVGFGSSGATESIVLTPSDVTVEPLESVTFVATAPAGVALSWAVQETGGGTIDVSGYRMSKSQKYRNLATNPNVAFVVDDIASRDPWRVRCLEIRGTAVQADVEHRPRQLDPEQLERLQKLGERCLVAGGSAIHCSDPK